MQDAAIPAGVVGGKVTRQAPEAPAPPSPAERVLSTLRSFGALLMVGRLLLTRIKPEWAEGRVAPLLTGALVLVLLGELPVLGGPVHLLAALLGLGALWLLVRDRFRGRRIAARLPEAGAEPPQAAMPAAA